MDHDATIPVLEHTFNHNKISETETVVVLITLSYSHVRREQNNTTTKGKNH